MNITALARFASIVLVGLMLTACGRAGPMERPQAGVTIMKPGDKPAADAVEDKPFVLDDLL
jgi:predicted small lipoprotein YifL